MIRLGTTYHVPTLPIRRKLVVVAQVVTATNLVIQRNHDISVIVQFLVLKLGGMQQHDGKSCGRTDISSYC